MIAFLFVVSNQADGGKKIPSVYDFFSTLFLKTNSKLYLPFRCDEWLCQLMCCTYRYPGLANPDEVTFASAIALQAYFEGRPITPENMKECLEFWKTNISEQTDPVGRKRPVCCEPYIVPCCYGSLCHKAAHPKRNIPYGDASEETKEVPFHFALLFVSGVPFCSYY